MDQPRRRLSAEQRRESILHAANEVFGDRGYEHVRIDDIANAAGISKALIYEHFRSKSELYIDTMVFHEQGLRHLVAEVGTDHIFYGTDYPFDWPVGIDLFLNATFLDNAQKEAILGGNLVKLLRLEPSR